MRASAAATAVSRLAAILSAARARLAYGQWSVKRMWRKAVQTMILHADAADGGDRGAEAADEVVVVEVELGREGVEPVLEDAVVGEDGLVGDGAEGDGVVHDGAEDVGELEEGDVGDVEAAGAVDGGVAVGGELGVKVVRGDGERAAEHERLPSASVGLSTKRCV